VVIENKEEELGKTGEKGKEDPWIEIDHEEY
jgi:hypothetical protein